jgi:biopolymer transport protein ExbD
MIFLLLIFFLLTSLAANPAVDLDLPASSLGETAAQTPQQVVAVLSVDQYRYAGTVYSAEEFREFLVESLAEKKMKTQSPIYIQADRTMMYGDLMNAVEPIAAAGFDSISFMVQRQPR